MMRLKHSALALALHTAECGSWTAPLLKTGDDPYARAPRSKGEKARNKKLRRG